MNRSTTLRLAWTALSACVLLVFKGLSAPAATLPLHDCRLEHPLKLSSVAARCGVLAVPENPEEGEQRGHPPDPAHPQDPGHPQDPRNAAGRRIELFVAVVPALNRRTSAEPLFLLAGGPGQAAADLYASYAGAFARANRNHDIVLVDQRGTGRSEPLVCSYPDDLSDTRDSLPALRRATAECLSKYGDRVRFYTTSMAVRDLDRVRLALGYSAIDLYGSSYGTRVAELYMRRHPRETHAVVLDGVTYPEQSIGPDTPLDGERALDLIVARCQSASDCSAAYPNLAAELGGLRRRFGPEKLPIRIADPTSGEPLPLEFNHGVFSASLRLLSYSATEASLLPTLVHQAAIGRPAPLAAETLMMARQIRDQLASGMQNSVICSEDVPFFHLGEEERQRIGQTYQGMEQLDALDAICKLWPRGPVDADLHAALRSEVPTLLLSGEVDPVTPPADAERLARGLSRVRHLIVPGEGHGQIITGCMPKLMADFLDTADPGRLDASCLTRHHPAPFFVGLTGPAP